MSALSNVATITQFPAPGQRKDNFKASVKSFSKRIRRFQDQIEAFTERHRERLNDSDTHELGVTVTSLGDLRCHLHDIWCEFD